MSNISIVVSFCSKSFGTGAGGKIPWNIPEERKNLADLTKGHVVVMGRRTFEDFGSRPLDGRFNVVVSGSAGLAGLEQQNMAIVRPELLDMRSEIIHGDERIFVVGGARLYEKYLGVAERVYATVIEKEFDGLDTFFPVLAHDGVFGRMYKIAEAGPRRWSETEGCFYRVVVYKKIESGGGLGGGGGGLGLVGEQGFLDLAREILGQPAARPDRTGVGTLSVFARQLRFDVSDTVPVLTTRALGVKTIVRELLWFLRGSCDSKELEREGVRIWAGNTSREFLDQRGLAHYAEGETGPLYGWSLRRFGAAYKGSIAEGEEAGCWGKAKRKSEHGQGVKGLDQLEELVAGLKADPFSRRHLMTTFNPGVVDQCVLAPCHGIAIQFYVEKVAGQGEEFQLSCHVYCRSSDTFLGLPFNIASYGILLHLVAKRCGWRPKELVISTGDTHIYANHVVQAWTQVNRLPLPMPKLIISEAAAKKDWSELSVDDFDFAGYLSHPMIRAEMAV